MKKLLFGILILGAVVSSFGQGKIGAWNAHLAYNRVNLVAQSDTRIYAVGDGSLFSVNKVDNELERYSKVDGLSDVNITRMEYDTANHVLLIVYQNGNIDLMSEEGLITNIPDLFRKQMSSSKNVNEIFFRGDRAYLSCDFGVMVVNIQRHEISDTYYLGAGGSASKVISTALYNNTIYAITNNQLLQSDAGKPHLLVNYEYWNPTPQPPGSGEFKKIFVFNNNLMLLRGTTLYMLEYNSVWTPVFPTVSVLSVNVSPHKIILNVGVDFFFGLNEQLEIDRQTVIYSEEIIFDKTNTTYWVAGYNQGLISAKVIPGSDPQLNYYKPSGIASNFPYAMTFAGKKLIAVQGGRWDDAYKRPGLVMIYEEGNWKNIHTSEFIDEIKAEAPNATPMDFVNVAINPQDPSHFFVTSYGTGLYEFKNDKFHKWHNYSNAPFTSIRANNPHEYTRLDGAVFDHNGNLLLCNMSDVRPFKIMSPDGKWSTLDYPEAKKTTYGNILINNQNPNQKWVNSVRYTPDVGIFVWDDNGTLNDISDDKRKFMSVFADADNIGSDLRPTYFYSMQQDQNGVMWVGTDIGPLLFYNTSRVFDNGYTCSRVKIPRNDGTTDADYLLKDVAVLSIAIDGANRKWLGTANSGVYLMSENGQETIYHFTAANSPLLSDNVSSIAINQETGEVFFGTGNGLVSFQSDAAGSSSSYSNVYAYPNPVRENYNGIITITGLISETQVKITDINGNLIYQTVSNGSIATWDGKDVYGRKVNTGIYFAICANKDGTQSTITKIMVIN